MGKTQNKTTTTNVMTKNPERFAVVTKRAATGSNIILLCTFAQTHAARALSHVGKKKKKRKKGGGVGGGGGVGVWGEHEVSNSRLKLCD